jgi:D-alanyl-D-alanine carboxypeptidase/Putative Flp pilus-assembly TadE/G-like
VTARRPSRERASASLVVLAALGLACILALFGADLARVATGRARVQSVADAAALAAAQELVAPSGRTPAELAEDYARRGGAWLVACRCSAEADDAVVRVAMHVTLPFLGQTRTVEASARAVVAAPPGTEGLLPFFAARLSCLFSRVPGLWIVSGFRTHAEQAALFQQKPELAAPPGHSNHELGLAADLGYPDSSTQRGAHAVASDCALEFPVPYEPWHVEPAGLTK